MHINTNYPGIDDIISKAKKRIPTFAFEYLDGGCNEDVNLLKNTIELRNIELKPFYLKAYQPPNLQTTIFGTTYNGPFGVAPVGLQGLMWPGATEILAEAATRFNVPFILSTVTTASIEKVAEITSGKAWFQLYHPAENNLRDNILERLEKAGIETLVILADVPSFGFRPRDIRNGLAMPPKMTLKNMLQIMGKPNWAINTLLHGQPAFATLKPYIPKGLNMGQLGLFMNKTFNGRLNEEKITAIRNKWKGKLVLKGVSTVEDAEMAINVGVDGIIVSNHGGRQLDAAESAIASLQKIKQAIGNKTLIMFDSGIRSGVDVARAVAAGAECTFLGRTFMYSVAALGKKGGHHAMALLETQLKQVLDQLGCASIQQLPNHLVK